MSETSENHILVICPCFNEDGSIGALIDEIKSLDGGYDVLVVDDGSTDNTYKVASEKTMTIRLPVNLGIGGAVQTGYRFAMRHSYKYVIQIDGDGQHDPSYIGGLLQEADRTGNSLVIGTRYKEKRGFQSSWMRRLGANVIAALIGKLFSFRPSDPTSGMRLTDRKLCQVLSDNYPVDYPEPLSLCFALHNGFGVSEVPVKMRERIAGKSSISGLKSAAYMMIVLVRILSTRIAKKG